MQLSDLITTMLYEADIFKMPFILLFQNRKKSSTVLGSLFSICIVGIVLYLFIKSNMVLKINPNVIDQTTTNPEAALIELTPENFEVAAGVADSFGKGYSDPTIFKIQFIQIGIGFNETINSKQITSQTIKKTKQCNQSSFSDPATFGDLGFANYTCLEDGNFQLEGGFDEKSLKTVVVMISYCDNTTDGVICKSLTEINTFFSNKGLWLYYQDNIYDVSNYQIPITKNWRLQAIQCASVPRIVDLYLKKLIFINDDQFIFSNERYEYGFMKERTEALSDYVMVESPLISINIFSSKNNQRTLRQYQKFGELMASIGGLINVLIILGFFITNLENQLQMQNFIMNTLYSYSYEQKEKKGESINKIDPHLWDWNKNYDEMFGKDMDNPMNPDEERRKSPEPKEENNSRGDKSKDETFSVNDRETPQIKPPIKEIELLNPPSRDLTSSIINLKLKDDLRILDSKRIYLNDSKYYNIPMKTEPTKLQFVRKKVNMMPRMSIQTSNKFSPTHTRIISPVLRPKEFLIVEPSESKEDKHFKDADDSKTVTMRIAEYFKMQVKVLMKKTLSQKEKLFLLSEKKFTQETDICRILEKIQEFEKFKLIMLSPDQLTLFNLLAKPLISLDIQQEELRRGSSYMIARSMREDDTVKNDVKWRISELKKYYKQMCDESHLSFIDENLLKLIEDDIFTK